MIPCFDTCSSFHTSWEQTLSGFVVLRDEGLLSPSQVAQEGQAAAPAGGGSVSDVPAGANEWGHLPAAPVALAQKLLKPPLSVSPVKHPTARARQP